MLVFCLEVGLDEEAKDAEGKSWDASIELAMMRELAMTTLWKTAPGNPTRSYKGKGWKAEPGVTCRAWEVLNLCPLYLGDVALVTNRRGNQHLDPWSMQGSGLTSHLHTLGSWYPGNASEVWCL